MRLSNIDLRYVAVFVILAPFGAFLIGPHVALAVGIAILALMILALVFERSSRVDAPGTEAGMATLYLWGAALVLGVLGTVTVVLAWRMMG